MDPSEVRPDYAAYVRHRNDQFRRLEALASDSPAVEVDEWPGLDAERRRRAEKRQRDLDRLVNVAYRRFIEPRRGSPEFDDAWAAFKRWRATLASRYTDEVFREDVGREPWLIAEPWFEEDHCEHEEILKAQHAEASASGSGPRGWSLVDAVQWQAAEAPIPSEYADVYRADLRRCGWQLVFHTTRLEHLPWIAFLGVLEGAAALSHVPGGVERDRRQQFDEEKEFYASISVCSSFWPPHWVPPKLGGIKQSVILGLDAEQVCVQPGTSFFPRPTREAGVTVEMLRSTRNDTAAGLRAFQDCWDPEWPVTRGGGPRPHGPEIHSQRIHPRHIKHLIFPDATARDRWFAPFLQTACENYDGIETKAAIWSLVDQNGRTFGFAERSPAPPGRAEG